MEITVDIPEKYLVNFSTTEMKHVLKLYTALLMYYSGKFSIGAACEFAEADRFEFIAACKKYNIPVINYSIQEVKKDLDQLKTARK